MSTAAPLPCSACGREMLTRLTNGRQTCLPCRKALKVNGRHCIDCGAHYKYQDRPRCAPCNYARAKARKVAAGELCSVAGCGRPATAGKYCHGCYSSRRLKSDAEREARRASQNAAYAAQRFERVCPFCQSAFVTKNRVARYCSGQCGRRAAFYSASKELAIYRPPAKKRPVWTGHELRPRKGSPMVSGPCAWCGVTVTGYSHVRYCSDRCQKRATRNRERFTVTDSVRFGVYDRDGWVCQLCGDSVPRDAHYLDPLAPTLDHIIPQSLSATPDHSEGNLRLAHRLCNSLRGNRVDIDFLIPERGLACLS